MIKTFVGVDGCKAGWFYFRNDGEDISFGITKTIHNLVFSLPEQSKVFIDIPIGLIDSGLQGRLCDSEARKLLTGKRASSVFSAPCRPVLTAQDYLEAKSISEKHIGKKLSQQSFAITPKIKEVDDFLSSNTKDVSVREIHPEICFWALNKKKALQSRKKDTEGYNERLALITDYIPQAKFFVEAAMQKYLRKEVARDDIVDALAALIVAMAPPEEVFTIPEQPVRDSRNLPMEIVYRYRDE